jgi:hypothetical protein
MVLCSSCDGVPLKRAGLQFTSTDYLSIALTPVRIRWTVPLKPFSGIIQYNVEKVGRFLFYLALAIIILSSLPIVQIFYVYTGS